MKLSNKNRLTPSWFRVIKQKVILLSAIFMVLFGYSVYATETSKTIFSDKLDKINPQKVVKGKVLDSSGNPLAGANVIVKGTKTGVLTDFDGFFNINVANDAAIIVISYVGMETREVAVSNSLITVVLNDAEEALDEIVVVAYGKQKKVNLSGAVNTVETKTIVNRPVTSLTNALQGTIPGLNIVSAPADIDKNQGALNIRGKGSLGASEPLYVLDGVIISANDFNRINSQDVESISVLKDASAAAIYGSRAAYGVILVTTKLGKSGKMQVNYNSFISIQSMIYKPSFLGSYDYAVLFNEANVNAGKAIRFTPDNLQTIQNQSNPDLYPDVDWRDLIYQKSTQMIEHQVSISGGTESTRYFISGSFNDQNSLYPGKTRQRYTFRTNLESKISEKFKIGTNFSFSRTLDEAKNGTPSAKVINKMIPLFAPRQTNGDWGSVSGGQIDGTAAMLNPLRNIAESGRGESNFNSFIGSFAPTYTPIAGLDIGAQVNYSFDNYYSSGFTNTTDPVIDYFSGQPLNGTGNSINSRNENWESNSNLLLQLTSSFEKNVGNHYAKILVGTSFEDNKYRSIYVNRKVYVNNTLNSIDAGSSAPENTTAGGFPAENAFSSIFGRLNYAFKNRYLFETSYRMDKSSKFPQGNRLGVFPSFSVAWRISQEDFLKNVDWISELKTRFSWGELGNAANVGNYDYNSVLVTGQTILDNRQVGNIKAGKYGNQELSWESTEMKNVGIDMGLFKNSLTLQIDAFDRLTKGILLVDPSLPDEAGLTGGNRPSTNKAYVDNKGIELSLNYNQNIRDVNFSIGGNISKIWNKVVELDSGNTDQIVSDGAATLINRIGEPVGSFYMYQADGLFVDEDDVSTHAFQSAATKPGDIKYIDQNGDNKIDASDRTIIKGSVPKFTYGLNLSITYKDFDLAILGQGVAGTKAYISEEGSQAFFNGAGVKAYALDRWTTANPNPNASYPRLLQSADNAHNLQKSSFWLFDTSYFRVKNISIGYTLPERFVSKINIQKFKVYFSSNNLFTLNGDKKLKDLDPENGNVTVGYPQLKSFALGLNISL